MGFATAKNIKITQFYSGNKKLGLNVRQDACANFDACWLSKTRDPGYVSVAGNRTTFPVPDVHTAGRLGQPCLPLLSPIVALLYVRHDTRDAHAPRMASRFATTTALILQPGMDSRQRRDDREGRTS